MRKKNVVTVGVFDGVHRGHRKILKAAVKIARQKRAKSIAVTFYPHPLSVVAGGGVCGDTPLRCVPTNVPKSVPRGAPKSIISLKHRLKLIKAEGIDSCVVIDFTKEFSKKSAEDFIKDILAAELNAGWVVVGRDFCFGRYREGDCNLLLQKSARYGFAVKAVEAFKYRGSVVSSSFIRGLITAGELARAEKLLGRPVTVLGTVVKGRKIGRELGFPTANINPHHEVVPPSGVYAVKVNIDPAPLKYSKMNKKRCGVDKLCYNGILNIGIRPTLYGYNKDDREPTIEVYIFDFKKSIYGKDIEVAFIKRLRKEKRFCSKEALIKQINNDIKKARQALWG